MITSAITVSSDGAIVLGAGATYGILLAILFCHGMVCSAATNVLARLNLFYVMVNGASGIIRAEDLVSDEKFLQWEPLLLPLSRCSCALATTGCPPRTLLLCLRTTPDGPTVHSLMIEVERMSLIIFRWMGVLVGVHGTYVDAHGL
jgi:hypothetical protein